MKFKQLMILCAVLLFSFSIVTANELYISDVTGLTAGGTIPIDGSTVTFTIGLNNTGPNNIYGSMNNFKVYSPTGAEWTTTVPDTAGSGITTAMYDGGVFVNEFSITGSGADTVGFGGFRLFQPGIPIGDIPNAYTVTIGPVDASYDGGEICIDSADHISGGAWEWYASDYSWVGPGWAGPHCYTIGAFPPSINPIDDFISIVDCDDNIAFTVVAAAPDGETLAPLTFTGLPAGASFDDVTKEFTWSPTAADVGDHLITFTATSNQSGLSTDEDVTISVILNQNPPDLTNIPDADIMACQNISFTAVATDPEGTAITYGITGKPASATFNAVTGVFDWTPVAEDLSSNPYNMAITATDECNKVSSDIVILTVTPDGAPTVTATTPQNFVTCVERTFNLTAVDPQSKPLVLEATGLDVFNDFTFTDNNNGTGSIRIKPTSTENGDFPISIIATDECGSADTIEVLVSVVADTPPVLSSIGDKTVLECDTLRFTLIADDPDGDNADIVFSMDNTLGGNFINGNVFEWVPGAADVSETPYDVTFTATDGCGSTTDSVVSITVEANSAPVISIDAGDTTHSVVEGDVITFTFSASDSDPTDDVITFGIANTQGNFTNVSLSAPNNNTVTFSWETISGDAGDVSFWLLATDECGVVDSEHVSITIVANSQPVINGEDIQAQIPESPQQGDSIIIDIEITDADIQGAGKLTTKNNSLAGNENLVIWVDTTSIPGDEPKWSLTDNGDGAAKFIWATDSLTPEGNHTLIFYASDGVDEVSFDAVVGIVTSVEILDGNTLPEDFYLSQNYPNPFNPETEIQFGIPERAHVSLAIYNVLGQKIKTLIDEVLSANRYTAYWDSTNGNGLRVASGIYLYKLEVNQYHETKKMIIIK